MRYIIGIDLGTTNSCVSFVDTQDPKLAIQPFRVPQLVAPGYVEARATLPSFCYLSSRDEWPRGSMDLPWKKNLENLVGSLAQSQGAKVPTKLVQSAKSWLCHSAAQRRDKILPSDFSDVERHVSPVEATAFYLSHIREAWNHHFARSDVESEFDQQDIILTVPASFDEVARRLTIEAAKMAGYVHLTLLEEPQAAFYSWISQHENQWQKQLNVGDKIIVCDVGGGTTDFSLIEVIEKEGQWGFNRLAVGNHLLLGGDNMDAALAHFIEEKISREQGTSDFQLNQWLQLKHQARAAKEALLNQTFDGSKPFTILIQGEGSSVIKGSVTTQVHAPEVSELLLKGFFGEYPLEQALQLRKTTGFKTMGLPYEEEPSITKHLAAFLKRTTLDQAPQYILFNGGSMKPALFQQAILQSLKLWYDEAATKVLPSESLDLAVARGAAYYGKVRRGYGVRIGGGIPQAYYLGVDIKNSKGELSNRALTLLSKGSEEGASYESALSFSVRPNTPVSFHLYTSNVRLEDQQGDLVDIDHKELQSLPPIHTILRLGKKQLTESATESLPVRLHIKLTEIGTLELWLQSVTTEHRWNLEFQLRNEAGQENSVAALDAARADEVFDTSYLQEAQKCMVEAFNSPSKIEKIMENLENLLEKPRREWSLSVLRGLCDTLLTLAAKRKTHATLESRWWNLVGFCLRPGCGYPLDDFRIKELWKILLGDFKNPKCLECQIQQWICYRRIAGGLNKGQQTQLASEILNSLLTNKNSKIILKSKSEINPYLEKIRALASFELLETSQKIKLGNALMHRIKEGQVISAEYWALGRLGARHLIFGSAAHVIPKEECLRWIEDLLKLPPNDLIAHLLGQLARKTDAREVNLSSATIDKILDLYQHSPSFDRLQSLLTETSRLTAGEQEELIGDKLPAGLVLEHESGK